LGSNNLLSTIDTIALEKQLAYTDISWLEGAQYESNTASEVNLDGICF
jgi:hypothetical protein